MATSLTRPDLSVHPDDVGKKPHVPDVVLAGHVKDAAKALTEALDEAAGAGLHCEVDVQSYTMQSFGGQKSVPCGWLVDATIARPL